MDKKGIHLVRMEEVVFQYRKEYLEALSLGFNMGDVSPNLWSEDEIFVLNNLPLDFFVKYLYQKDEYVCLPNKTIIQKPQRGYYWCIDTDNHKFIGAIELRHQLDNSSYAAYGGHISIGVQQKYQGQGHAVMMYRSLLPIAKELGIENIMVCCREQNIASRKAIERAGGIYMDKVIVTYDNSGDYIKRYILRVNSEKIC